jgi:predicted amidohydrolase
MFPECPGANDDIAVFELRDGNFPLRGSDGNTITAKRRLIAQPHPLWLSG